MSLLEEKPQPIRITRKMVKEEVTFDESDLVLVTISRDVILRTDSEHIVTSYDPLQNRKHFWQKNFGLEPLPIQQTNAAETFAGSLGESLDLTSSEMKQAIDKADQA